MLVSERDEMLGAGRALPHRGFSALQPCRISIANSSALNIRKEALFRFINASYTRMCGLVTNLWNRSNLGSVYEEQRAAESVSDGTRRHERSDCAGAARRGAARRPRPIELLL